jgi:hypothetical protein
VSTGTFVLACQIAEVFMLAVAHAWICDPEDAFTTLAFELQFFQFFSDFLV